MLPVTEDTLAPTAPAALEGTFRQWNHGTSMGGQANEDGTEWMLYRNLNNDLSDESSWVSSVKCSTRCFPSHDVC